jgi:hypothetical protein
MSLHPEEYIMNRRATSVLAALLALASSASAFATPTIGNAGVEDVLLGSTKSDAYAFSLVNPSQGSTGNTSGFATAFASAGTGSWNLFGKVADNQLAQGTASFTFGDLTIAFMKSTGTSGTWSVTNTDTTHDATLDLVLAMHASNASSAFLFDNQSILAGQTLTGSWTIEWLNNGGKTPAFSNVAFFNRDLTRKALPPSDPDTPPTGVPEPASLALLGLGMLSMIQMLKRKKV